MKTLIEMAHEVKMPYDFVTGEPINIEKLEAFAKLVRADEREACAKVIESHGPFLANGAMLAEAIRARGNT